MTGNINRLQFAEQLEQRVVLSTITFVAHPLGEATGARTAADFDADGDFDIASGGEWCPNLNGLGEFGNCNQIVSTTGSHPTLKTIDIDGDNDLDLVVASIDRGLSWYQNIDGKGTYSEEKVIVFNVGVYDFAVGDVDGDADMDVVWSRFDLNPQDNPVEIAWSPNIDQICACYHQNDEQAESWVMTR